MYINQKSFYILLPNVVTNIALQGVFQKLYLPHVKFTFIISSAVVYLLVQFIMHVVVNDFPAVY